jgi:hypothetical protein
MDRSYFNILDSIDPMFHSFVLSRLNETRGPGNLDIMSADDLDQDDQLEVLRRYCVALHTESSALRSAVLENMEVCSRSVRFKRAQY